MDDRNFDSLKRIKTPQAWLDKAAAIPEAPRKKRPFPLYRFAAVASIVFVSVIGLLMFLFFGGSEPVGVRNSPIDSGTSQAGQTDETGKLETGAAEATGAPATDAQGNAVIRYAAAIEPTALGTLPSENQKASVAPTDVQNSTDKTSPTVPATDRAVTPTEAPKETEPPQPTAPPPTAPPVTQKPTEADRPPGDCEFYGTFHDDKASGSGNYVAEEGALYCLLYDSSGRLVGDSAWYSPQREAKILSRFSDGSVLAYYNPIEKGLFITAGEYVYEYVFCDVHGNELYRGVKYVF